jgi:AcrR family transcriptional regulator
MMAADTRGKILQVAARLFVRQGYTATSINQISKEAGIGKATVYHHFSDKQAIAFSLLESATEKVRQGLSVVRTEDNPRRRIEAIANAAVRMRAESFDLFQVIRREVPGSRTRLHTQLAAIILGYTIQVTDAVKAGIGQGIFRPVDPADAARALLTMVTGLYVQIYLSGNRIPEPEKAMRPMLEIFFKGIDSR